jgi:hypothetical protein
MRALIKTPLPFADLNCTEVIEKKHHYIEYFTSCFRWVYEALVNFRDSEDSTWYERTLSYDFTIRKDMVSSIDLSFTTNKLWMVDVYVNGEESGMRAYFKKEENARELVSELRNYIFNL